MVKGTVLDDLVDRIIIAASAPIDAHVILGKEIYRIDSVRFFSVVRLFCKVQVSRDFQAELHVVFLHYEATIFTLRSEATEQHRVCWPIHDIILHEVQPKKPKTKTK